MADPELDFYRGEAFRELRRMGAAEKAYERAGSRTFRRKPSGKMQLPLRKADNWRNSRASAVARRRDVFRWRSAIENEVTVDEIFAGSSVCRRAPGSTSSRSRAKCPVAYGVADREFWCACSGSGVAIRWFV